MNDKDRRKNRQLVQKWEHEEREEAYQRDISLTREAKRKAHQEQNGGNSATGSAAAGNGQANRTKDSAPQKAKWQMPSNETLFGTASAVLIVVGAIIGFAQLREIEAEGEKSRKNLQRTIDRIYNE